MQTKCILFDMDGTLLPMDAAVFARTYFKLLTKKMLPHGYEPEAIINGINAGITATQTNDGTQTNEELFWEYFIKTTGERVCADRAIFEDFYAVDFQRISSSCGFAAQAKETVALCKELGFRVVIATEPIFPLIAMESRLRWAGVDPSEAEFITSYETSHYCKPDLGYYREVAERLGVQPEECAMVGNDVGEDMPAGDLGMKLFLLTDCLINKKNADINQWEHGGFGKLQSWLRSLKNGE
ncbi:MAG: HAD family hydrolase [Ruminococcaceae bacterium]|nr:HAD family hydrolase [Oscillospiraceae bacterium]